MCGIVGYLTKDKSVSKETIEYMAEQIRHRGPDAKGTWAEPNGRVALAHRRLSIVDLSDAGAQPMCSPSGTWVISYNGEIYNHRDLRKIIDSEGWNIAWRGHSDTETLVVAIECWGFQPTLDRIRGMFAIAAWHTGDHKLFLVLQFLQLSINAQNIYAFQYIHASTNFFLVLVCDPVLVCSFK